MYIHTYRLSHIEKHIESPECKILCTDHYGTSHAISVLQSFIALRLFFTSPADKIASERGMIYNKLLTAVYGWRL